MFVGGGGWWVAAIDSNISEGFRWLVYRELKNFYLVASPLARSSATTRLGLNKNFGFSSVASINWNLATNMQFSVALNVGTKNIPVRLCLSFKGSRLVFPMTIFSITVLEVGLIPLCSLLPIPSTLKGLVFLTLGKQLEYVLIVGLLLKDVSTAKLMLSVVGNLTNLAFVMFMLCFTSGNTRSKTAGFNVRVAVESGVF